MKQSTYSKIAQSLNAMNNCIKSKNTEWEEKHRETIEKIMQDAPSGSGIDNGTKFNFDLSTDEKLVFNFGYHHMNEAGYYDGWTEHTAVLTPSLMFGYKLKITGKDKNYTKDYLHELYSYWLSSEIE